MPERKKIYVLIQGNKRFRQEMIRFFSVLGAIVVTSYSEEPDIVYTLDIECAKRALMAPRNLLVVFAHLPFKNGDVEAISEKNKIKELKKQYPERFFLRVLGSKKKPTDLALELAGVKK